MYACQCMFAVRGVVCLCYLNSCFKKQQMFYNFFYIQFCYSSRFSQKIVWILHAYYVHTCTSVCSRHNDLQLHTLAEMHTWKDTCLCGHMQYCTHPHINTHAYTPGCVGVGSLFTVSSLMLNCSDGSGMLSLKICKTQLNLSSKLFLLKTLITENLQLLHLFFSFICLCSS